VKIERLALLEPIAGLFLIIALYQGWRWAETGRWRWALAAGATAGLAAGAKVSGVLVLPVVIGGVVVIRRFPGGHLRRAALVVLCAASALATYLPLGRRAFDAIRYMYWFQSRHQSLWPCRRGCRAGFAVAHLRGTRIVSPIDLAAPGKPIQAVVDDPAYHHRLSGRLGRAYQAYLAQIRPQSSLYHVDRLDMHPAETNH
jgi:hypothetical protein